MKAMLEDYNNVYNEPKELFNISLLHFRDIMCSTKYSIEQKDDAFANLLSDYLRLPLDQKQIIFFMTTKKEWEMRKEYEIIREVCS